MRNSCALAFGLAFFLSSNFCLLPALSQQGQYPPSFQPQYASSEQAEASQQYGAVQQNAAPPQYSGSQQYPSSQQYPNSPQYGNSQPYAAAQSQQYGDQTAMQGGWQQQPPMQQSGMQQPPMQQPGMQQSGMQQPPMQTSQYDQQEQAIQKGLADNRVNQSANDNSQSGHVNWNTSTTSEQAPGGHSKIRGAAGAATKVLAKTAAVALPTVGLIFLTRAMNRNTGYGGMNNMNGMGYGMGGYPYQGGYMNGYGQPYNYYNGW